MKLRIIYGLIYGILGLLAAGLTAFLFISGFGLFWNFTFGVETWPAWSRWVFLGLFGITSLVVFSVTRWAIQRGFEFANRLQEEDERTEIKAFEWVCVIFTFFVLLLTIQFFVTSFSAKNSSSASLATDTVQIISTVELFSIDHEDGIEISAHAEVDPSQDYQLLLNVYMSGRPEAIKVFKQDVFLDSPQQKFVFIIPHDEFINRADQQQLSANAPIELNAQFQLTPKEQTTNLNLLSEELAVMIICSTKECKLFNESTTNN